MDRLIAIGVVLVLMAAGCRSGRDGAETVETEGATQFRVIPATPSRVGHALLSQIWDGQFGVEIRNLPRRQSTELPKGTYESIQILPPSTVCDAFTHTVFVDHRSKQYWILRTGGVAGVNELYGPGTFSCGR
ncbi:MAG: hypothetical protein A3K19_15260 [Lentisphaerae bacterium RIFOXYB12_FULL_65_16]|nr:MAG: hypothetical protein A3K18_06960 [Lentisphaerae bacterium RIFOXYA12_64_32]OGV88450.1 MAG: hypothetical protein A3K19_15260 [Lentisphaerae bacterium RIFOXYB12_FULL_65_16]